MFSTSTLSLERHQNWHGCSSWQKFDIYCTYFICTTHQRCNGLHKFAEGNNFRKCSRLLFTYSLAGSQNALTTFFAYTLFLLLVQISLNHCILLIIVFKSTVLCVLKLWLCQAPPCPVKCLQQEFVVISVNLHIILTMLCLWILLFSFPIIFLCHFLKLFTTRHS